MKKLIILLVLFPFLCFPLLMKAQLEHPAPPDWNALMKADNANYYTIRGQVLDYFTTYPPSDNEFETEEEGNDLSYTNFLRWSEFWESRVTTSDPRTNGLFSNLLAAYTTYAANPVCSGQGPYASSWQLLGPVNAPNQTMGLVDAVEQDPGNSSIIYAGTNNSGVWKTVDGGLNWVNKTDYLKYPGMGVSDILIDPSNSSTLYISTGGVSGYGIGVLKSTDGGNTWSQTGLNFTPSQGIIASHLRIDPTNSNVLYAITNYDVWTSTDAGVTWTSIKTITPSCWMPLQLADLEILPGNNNVLFAAEVDWNTCNGGAKIWRLEKVGLVWNITNVTPPPVAYPVERFELAVSPATPDLVYTVYDEENVVGPTWASYHDTYTNTTNSWGIPAASGIAVGYFDHVFEVSPADANIMYMGTTVAWKSTNGGTSFSPITTYNGPVTHADVRNINIFTGSVGGASDVVYLGTDGGVCKTTNGGTTWSNKNGNGLATTQFYGIGNSNTVPDILAGGTQDNGVYTDTYGAWSNVIVGDAYDCEIDQVNPAYMYLCVNGGGNSLNRSSNSGISWSYMTQPPGPSRTTRPIVINDLDKNLYIGYHDVYECTNPRAGSPTWTALSNFTSAPSGDVLKTIMPAPSDPNTIYAAFSRKVWGGNYSNIFYKTTNHGSTWTDLAPNSGLPFLAWGTITHIEVDPYNSSRLWITWDGVMTTPGNNRVYYSGDGGATWTDYSTNLPGLPMNDLVYERGTNDGLYVATDVGVYYRNATMSQWECYSYQLPCIYVSDLEINYGKNTLRAATYGRGIWESNLACPLNYSLTLSGATSTSAFQEAQTTLTSTQQITGGDILYRAGNYVLLNPGFSATTTGYFSAYIHACDIIGNSELNTRSVVTGDDEESSNSSSVRKTEEDGKLEVYPNPNDGHFTVMSDDDETRTIQVFNVLGEMVYEQNGVNQKREDIDLSGYPKGMYMLNVTSGGKRHSKRIILK